MNCAACTLSRYLFLMKRSGVSIKRYNTGQRQMRAHRVSRPFLVLARCVRHPFRLFHLKWKRLQTVRNAPLGVAVAATKTDQWPPNPLLNLAKLCRVSKMGRRDSRRLLITGAMSVMRRAIRKGPPIGAWLAKMLAGKRRMLVATALANKLTRTVWALTTRKDVNRIPPLAA